MPKFIRTSLLFSALMMTSFMSGCIAVTAIDLAADTVSTGAKVTGKVVGVTVDAVTTSKEEREKKELKKLRKQQNS